MEEEVRAPRWRPAAVEGVAHQWMALVPKVRADLVLPPRVQQELDDAHGGLGPGTEALGLHRGEEVACADDLGARHPAPRAARHGPGRPAQGRQLQQRRLQQPGRRRHRAPAEADVALPDPPGREVQPRGEVAPVAPGPEHRPGRLPVQPVDEAVLGEGIPGHRVLGPQPLRQPLLELGAAAAARAQLRVSVVAKDHSDRPSRRLPQRAEVGPHDERAGLGRCTGARSRGAEPQPELPGGPPGVQRSSAPLQGSVGGSDQRLETGMICLGHGVHEAENTAQAECRRRLVAQRPSDKSDVRQNHQTVHNLLATAAVLKHGNGLLGNRNSSGASRNFIEANAQAVPVSSEWAKSTSVLLAAADSAA
eukprot:CAMPEP_0175769552 /NCGR_PEP_ID=MMETSP0097-20121207/71019_1 /TAXON_ID=311494 /ORGANISM="Alexandrium monilatum, Strain CCMP3105" /LENGTH=363 /DNA_ID=CAMNT_0017079731 /DNA_START=133 /DNA_END=1221 /DNA_ORIENTATION=+